MCYTCIIYGNSGAGGDFPPGFDIYLKVLNDMLLTIERSLGGYHS